MSNHLINESSPYLLQHAANPVDWYPWGSTALEKARLEDKPIFLSIGYAACHWCHVMAHESFEDPDIANLMNSCFVSIKVDREQRPDLDSIYMNFVVATIGQGGWPLSVFLTPEAKPFYGGTYFPPDRRHNLPAFRDTLETVARLWRTDRAAILSSGETLTQSLQARPATKPAGETLSPGLLEQVTQIIAQSYDWKNGGWGGAPKFPQPMLIEFLLRQGSRGDRLSLNMATHALYAMAQGGMYDILAGGFARYSVDPTWLIPHFEKMLYDNAQLALVYLHTYQLAVEPVFREVCEATLDFVLREMSHPAGGFYSSLDADSEGEEGKYYLWSTAEIRTSLPNPDDADLFIAAYGVTESGNFEGRNILRSTLTAEQLAKQFQLDASVIPSRLATSRNRLLMMRNSRVRPGVDDKVLVSWNALMLTAFAEAGRALGRRDYVAAAIKNANFILKHMLPDDRMMRSWREGTAIHDAYLEDHAGLALALLTLYQTDPDPRWYQAATHLLEQILAHFDDPSGGFCDTRDDHEALLYRPKDLQDNATPSGNALATMVLLQLATYEGRSDWRKLADGMLSSNLGLMMRYPSAFAQWLCAADFAIGPVHEVAVLGDLAEPATLSMLLPLWRGYHPRLVLAASPYPPVQASPALLSNRQLLNGQPTAYICQDFVCQLPVNDPEQMLAQLQIGVKESP
ncbi:MAG: thioredoxin domain-containing protein [Anaerolineales bacterium]